VRFESIYPGINLVYRGTQGRLEYDFVIAPNADPSHIKMNIEGADALSLDGDRNLVIKTASGEVIQKAPVIYQESHGAKHPISGGYALLGKRSVAFKLGAYDRSAPLIIDPLLTYVSYLGGGGDTGTAIAVDSTGAALVTGTTTSTNFPVTTNPIQSTNFGQTDVFVSKVAPDGTSLVYSTYLGGTQDDSSSSIAVDPMGNAYLTGVTGSADYPISVGAFQSTFTGMAAFVTALDPSGGLIYSTFLGQYSMGNGIAVDSAGDAWVIGPPPGGSLPTTSNAFLRSCPHTIGALHYCMSLTELNPEGNALIYSSLFDGVPSPSAVALDSAGNVFIAGTSAEFFPPSSSTEFTGPNPDICVAMSAIAGCGFLVKLNSSGSSIVFAAVFPFPTGNNLSFVQDANSLAVDGAGNAHLLVTSSQGSGSFLVNVTPTGAATIDDFSFNVDDVPSAITEDPMGNLWIAGIANSDDIATTPGAFQTKFAGGQEGFLIELDPSGIFTLYSTYLGGSSGDGIEGLASDSSGNAYVTGFTQSSDFPSTTGVFQPKLAGAGGNAFVARIEASPRLSPTLTPTVTGTPTATPTVVPVTPTQTATPSATITRTALPTRVPPTSTASIAIMPISTPFSPPTPIAAQTATATTTPTITATPTATTTPTPTATATPVGPVTYAPKSEEIKFPTRRINTTSALKFVTMSNPKKNKVAISITGVALQSQGTSGFNINSLETSCIAGHPVEAGKSCRIAIYFAPKASGDASDMLRITGNMINNGSIALTGASR
jgi:Beta-propeller repeat/Abnormal spindle-like microcephaly-assoc'd, ASPM-SPD-2-Hydin